MSTTTPAPPEDPLLRAFEGSSHIWVFVLLGVVLVAIGVIVIVAGWHGLPLRKTTHLPEHTEPQ
jgi:hypothetical protein